MFQDPESVYNCFRQPILGVDNGHNGGVGNLRGMPFLNVDSNIKKNPMITERFGAEFAAVFTNVFNHNQLDRRRSLDEAESERRAAGLARAKHDPARLTLAESAHAKLD
jgi:hypothetical protein